jgi:hypothetical protein
LLYASEKLTISTISFSSQLHDLNSLLEEDPLVLGVLLGVLAEALVLDQGHVGADISALSSRYGFWADLFFRNFEDPTHGNIMSVLVFLSSYCAGPFHLRHLQVSDVRRSK